MSWELLSDNMAPGMVWALLAAVLSSVIALASGVFMIQGKRVPPVALGLVAGLPALSMWAWGLPGLGIVVSGISEADAGREVAQAFAARMMTLFFAVPPVVLLLMFTAFVGARRPPRRWMPAAAGSLLLLLSALAPVIYGLIHDDWAFPFLRAMLYLTLVIPVAISLLGGNRDEGAGPEAGAAAGVAFATVVTLGEVSGKALLQMLLTASISPLTPDERLTYVDAATAKLIDPMVPYQWLAIGAAMVAALVGISGAIGGKDRSPIPAIASVCWLAVLPALYIVGDPGSDTLKVLLLAAP